VIEAPSILGLKPTGVDRLPQALLENRLAERVGARHAGRVVPLPYDGERDASTGTLNARDEDGKAGRELTNLLVAALGTSAPWSTTG
jgi:hypothetical protein